MEIFASPWALVGFVGLVTCASLWLAPRHVSVAGFFEGADRNGGQPSLWVLVLSQVTTWIFARSLMNAAILGYFYGFAGTLAYTTYYLSFLSGGYIVSRMRRDHAGSVQDWLFDHFGRMGAWTYNVVIALRLLSEVFANLIVVGLIFAAAFPDVAWAEAGSVVALALIGLIYSALGGLRASLRTDVLQMVIFLVVFIVAFGVMVLGDGFSFGAIFGAQGVHDQASRPGWVLVAVAALQVFSYPAHDPVMMDRGFLADEETTRKSFVLAFIISALCIFGFGMFGIQAGLIGAAYENQLLGTWAAMFGPFVYFLIAASLLISAISTLDSALASAARLVIDEFNVAVRSVLNGRIAMVFFMVGGAILTLWGNKTLFDAVAVSGTASMFLTPVLILAFMGMVVPRWSYMVAWTAAILGAAAYMYRGTELVSQIVNPWISTSEVHKYDQLLVICIAVLVIGFAAGILGIISNRILAVRA
ncbi:sodium:proline symporter [Amylibacter kogurei]|uniref:Sodium:proline symporter n=1 Tax=Paramylibacter kogurei TaxID=1889778 RepID=A0A2G5K5N5_9RHOB|nr:sodium:proline symporter [Amylibacter kogurei]PIB24342.1 sodium:proline symporter [Amylibacter kogurei]